MYAVIETGGKQYRVAPGESIEIETLEGDAGSDRRKNNGNEEGLRNSHSLGVPPNEMRLSCGAERERSQTEFYDTGR